MDIITPEQRDRRIAQLGVGKFENRDYTYAMDDDPYSYPKKPTEEVEVKYSNLEDPGIYL